MWTSQEIIADILWQQKNQRKMFKSSHYYEYFIYTFASQENSEDFIIIFLSEFQCRVKKGI